MTFWWTRSLLKGLSSLRRLFKPFVTMRALWKRSSRGIQMITAQCKAAAALYFCKHAKKNPPSINNCLLVSDLSCCGVCCLPTMFFHGANSLTFQPGPPMAKDGPLTAARKGQGKAPWHCRATGVVWQSNGPKAGETIEKHRATRAFVTKKNAYECCFRGERDMFHKRS